MLAYIKKYGCPAMLEWTGGMWNSLRSDSHNPKTPPHPVLLGESEREGESQGQRTKDKGPKTQVKTRTFPSFRHGSSRNPFFTMVNRLWIPACAGMTVVSLGCLYFYVRCYLAGFDLGFDLRKPFCVVEHCRLRAEKREDCLSTASSAVPALRWSAQRRRGPTR